MEINAEELDEIFFGRNLSGFYSKNGPSLCFIFLLKIVAKLVVLLKKNVCFLHLFVWSREL